MLANLRVRMQMLIGCGAMLWILLSIRSTVKNFLGMKKREDSDSFFQTLANTL